MLSDTAIAIGYQPSSFPGNQALAGRCGSTSEVLRAGLRLLEEREAQVRGLHAALVEGDNLGEPTAFDFEAFINRKRAEHPRP